MDGFIKLLICFSSFIPTFFFFLFFGVFGVFFPGFAFYHLLSKPVAVNDLRQLDESSFPMSFIFFFLPDSSLSPFHLGMKETIPRATDGGRRKY